MDSTTIFTILSNTFTKILRPRRPSFISGDISGDHQDEIEALIANLFAGISALKAAYAQLQLAHLPYDAHFIHSADRAAVAQFKRLSDLKQSFFKKTELKQSTNRAQAEFQEQRSLLTTYKIITAKLESELRSKESEISFLRSDLRVSEKQFRSLAALDELHLSGVNPTHFLTLLRSTVKSIRSFVKIMVLHMKSDGWDLSAAATAIQPHLRGRWNANHNIFAFQSYVSRVMFSDFEERNFGLDGPVGEGDRRSFFSELKFANQKKCFEEKNSHFGEFCRGKYLALVHPKMEASFFGNLNQRKIVSSGQRSPETEFFERFAEMARRIWLLHCLFFSFEDKGDIYEARKGSRFSEVYMESVAEEEESGGESWPAVGFTVVPGFRVGRTVIQCRVCLVYSID